MPIVYNLDSLTKVSNIVDEKMRLKESIRLKVDNQNFLTEFSHSVTKRCLTPCNNIIPKKIIRAFSCFLPLPLLFHILSFISSHFYIIYSSYLSIDSALFLGYIWPLA